MAGQESTADHAVSGLQSGVVGVTDMNRALDFYCGLLRLTVAERRRGADGRRERVTLTSDHGCLDLQELGDERGESAWVRDDLQRGMRHIGLKVDDVDRWAERLRAAGTVFTLEPQNAFGDVRICFFLDPDGSHLEFVQGNVNYTTVMSPILVAQERATLPPASPRFDHVAITAASLDAALEFYCGHLGFPVLGQLRQEDPARGFTITYLQADPGIVELFTFSEPLLPNSFGFPAQAPGLLYMGLATADVATAVTSLKAGGATLLRDVGDHGTDRALLTDVDGTPLEIGRVPAGRDGA
jgi:catechol 2,3-dioxygenase-like lactoylglutathione lyase family enzyme